MAAVISTPANNPRLSRAEAAKHIGVSVPTLASWATRGGGPAYIKSGAKVVYLTNDLDAWMASRRITHTAEL
jgi:predicted DNA-binding transcriptional regulator AlpA